MATSLLELLFGSSKNVNVFVLFSGVKFSPLRFFLEDCLLTNILGCMQGNAFEILMFENPEIIKRCTLQLWVVFERNTSA